MMTVDIKAAKLVHDIKKVDKQIEKGLELLSPLMDEEVPPPENEEEFEFYIVVLEAIRVLKGLLIVRQCLANELGNDYGIIMKHNW